MKDYYAVLDVPREATSNAIKIAYEDKLKKVARLSEARRAAKEAALKEAFAVLSNPAKREHFDARLVEVDAGLSSSGSNAPLIVGIVVVLLTIAGVGYFLADRSKTQKAMQVEKERAAAQRAKSQR